MNTILCVKPRDEEIDRFNAPALRDQLLSLEAPAEVLVDMSGVRFCDSSGINALIDGWKYQHQAGGSLVLCGARPIVHHCFALIGARQVLAPSLDSPL